MQRNYNSKNNFEKEEQIWRVYTALLQDYHEAILIILIKKYGINVLVKMNKSINEANLKVHKWVHPYIVNWFLTKLGKFSVAK